MPRRRGKSLRLNYYSAKKNNNAHVTIYADPSEAVLSASPKSFVSVNENSVTLAGGVPSRINIQGLSGSLFYGGMLTDLPFPLSTIPVTPFTPFPKQVFRPPLKNLMKTIRDISLISSSFVGL